VAILAKTIIYIQSEKWQWISNFFLIIWDLQFKDQQSLLLVGSNHP
jgi:hypothetical protein